MNERELRRILKRLVVLTAPLPLAIVGAACGGSAMEADSNGGSASNGGAVGSATAGETNGGSVGVAGSTVGGSSMGGSSAGAVGGGGSSAGTSGAAGSTIGGSSGAGGSTACVGNVVPTCGTATATVPIACVDAQMDKVGTALPDATCAEICGPQGPTPTCSVGAVDATSVTVNCMFRCFTGRLPHGLCTPLALQAGALGSYFSSIAGLEAASVEAFRILRRELRAHRAPKKLVRAAARAARDEVRHARATGALARRFGARPTTVSVERATLRSIEAMALENAVEGCVRETYGALLATYQSRAARDPVVRAVMKRIASDETRHAALSWDVGRWLETRLDREARSKVLAAKQVAARELVSSAASEAMLSFGDVVGLPGAAQASQLALEMARALWS